MKLWAVVLVILCLTGNAVAADDAQYWSYRVFPRQWEKFVYAITTITPTYDEWAWLLEEDWGDLSDEEWNAYWEEHQDEEAWEQFSIKLVEETIYHEFEVWRRDEQTVEITTAYRYTMPIWELQNPVDLFGGFFGPQLVLLGGGWVSQMLMISVFTADLRLEVGNSIETQDGWIYVAGQRTVAGLEGFVCQSFRWELVGPDEFEAIMTSEWVLAPDVGLPLSGRIYDGDFLVYFMELREYDALP